MSTKINANLKAIELTQAELDSVTGGNLIGAMQAMQHAILQRRIQQALSSSTGKGVS
jgi:hypothetical protein